MCRWLFLLGAVLGLSACASAPRSMTEDKRRLHEPGIPFRLAEHLSVLMRPELQGRVTGSRSFALAAQYVTDRLREFRLQPALAEDYRIIYQARVHFPWPVTLGWSDQDTAAFFPGLEFWPSAQSDTGRVVADQVALCSRPAGCPPAPLWVLPATFADEASVLAQVLSVQAVLLVGTLRPQLANAPVPGLRMLQVTPEAAARLLALPLEELNARLAGTAASLLQLRRALHLRVQRLTEMEVGALNVLGFVAGKDPILRKELVIVCADLDEVGLPGSSLLVEGAHLGEGVAALLELARFYSTLATYWPLPQRTLLFAVWSGARQGHQGLAAYLRQPLWDLAATRRILYLDPDPETLPQLQRLAATYGLALHPVLPPDSLSAGRQIFFKIPTNWQQAYRRIYNRPPTVVLPDFEVLQSHALQRASALAQMAQAVLLPEAVTTAPWIPVRADTLRIPSMQNRP